MAKNKVCFNFKTKKECEPKTILDALKAVDTVISPYHRLDAKPSDCKVIEYFEDKNLFVAYPSSALDKVSITDSKQCHEGECSWRGRMQVGKYNRSFSIKDKVLYIGKV